MTGFEAQCKFCPDKIWMEKDGEGKWKPMDINNHSSKHVHRKEQEQKQVLGDPNYQSNPLLVPQAEARVREIVREELTKMFVELAVRFEKARP